MKTITRSVASLSPNPTITMVPLAIIALHSVNGWFGRIRSFLLGTLSAIVLAATAATPGLAGSGGFNNTGSMNVAREHQTATLLSNGEVLVAGGDNDTTGYLSSAELYNRSTGRWTLTGSMTVPRMNHEAVLLQNGQVLLAGGLNASTYQGPPLASAELYNPSTGTWAPTGSMITGRESFDLTLLPNGEVLAAGGFSNPSSAELYNPATGTWTTTGNITGGSIGDDAAVLLQNGEVFAASNNLYNPSTGTWITTSSPSTGGSPPIVLLPNGDVFTGGNIQGDGLYNPSTNQWTSFAPPPCTRGG